MNIASQSDESGRDEVELPRDPISSNNLEILESYGELVVSDYRQYKREFMEWLLIEGKNLYKKEGCSNSTVEHTHYKVDEAYRWKWRREDEYSTEFTTHDATDLVEFMVRMTSHPDRYVYDFEKSLRQLFKFLRDERGRNIGNWEIESCHGTAFVTERRLPGLIK